MAAANNEQQPANPQRGSTELSSTNLEFVDGQLQADIPARSSRGRVSATQRAQNSDGGSKEDPMNDLEVAVKELNKGQANGILDIYENGSQVMVSPTPQFEAEVGKTPTANTITALSSNCGENGLSTKSSWTHLTITIKLDDDNTDELTMAIGAGATASELSALIISLTGVGAVSAPVAHALAAVLGYYTLDLATNNDGCGVEIDIYLSASWVIPTYDIDPQ